MVRELCSRLIGAWKKFGMVMGDTVARVALLLVFWITVVPIGLMWRVLGKDPMRRQWLNEKSSYFEDSATPDPEHWQRMF